MKNYCVTICSINQHVIINNAKYNNIILFNVVFRRKQQKGKFIIFPAGGNIRKKFNAHLAAIIRVTKYQIKCENVYIAGSRALLQM